MASTPRQHIRDTFDRLPAVPEFRSSDALGRVDAGALVSLEFQVGTSLVWFQFGAASDEGDSIAKGNKLLRLAHASIEQAMQLANKACRSSIPDFWTEFDNTTSKGSPLSIWGVRLHIDDGDIEYDVGVNHELFFSSLTTFSVLDVYEENPIPLPDFPDRHHIYVVRTRADAWSVHSSAD
jgi:hypothetical protein